MHKKVVTAALVLSCLSLVGCSSNNSVEQPKDDLSQGNISDPAVSEAKLQKAGADCMAGAEIKGRPVRVVSTVAPITNLVGLIAGDIGPVVQGIVPEGTNSHTFEPPPSAVATLETADIIFVNGMMLEDPTLELAKANAPKAVICELGTSSLAESDWMYDFSFPKEGGKPNPHLWTNPPNVLPYLSTIRNVLVKADPTNIDKYDENYVLVSQLVMNLDEAMKVATATIPANDRNLLTYHDAYA